MVRRKTVSEDQPRGSSRGGTGRGRIGRRQRKRKDTTVPALRAADGDVRSPAEKPAPSPTTSTREKRATRSKSKTVRRKKTLPGGASRRRLQPAGPPTNLNVVPPVPPVPVSGYVDRGPELPRGYEDDRVVAMARDPRCIFVYWELGGGARERICGQRTELESGIWVLRLEEVAEPRCEGRFFDVPVDPSTGNWYLHVEPETDYRVRLGVVRPSGEFTEAAASEVVATPGERPSEGEDEEWLILTEDFDLLLQKTCHGQHWPGGASDILHRQEGFSRRLRLSSGSLSGTGTLPTGH